MNNYLRKPRFINRRSQGPTQHSGYGPFEEQTAGESRRNKKPKSKFSVNKIRSFYMEVIYV